MRHRFLTAVAFATLALAACSDQRESPTEPAVPEPEEHLGSCRPVRFPLLNVANQIRNVVFQTAPAKVRLEALARAGAVALLWDTCHPVAARLVAVRFVGWIDQNAPSSVPESQVTTLKVTILNGVGVPVSAPPADFPDDFGVGLFDPTVTTKTLIKTISGRALVELEPGSFLQPTVITISRKADNFPLTNFTGRQFPPKYDYDAVNSSGTKVLAIKNPTTGERHTAIVAFCLLSLDDEDFPAGEGFPAGYPEHPRIGHNPVAGAPGAPFEILPEVDLEEAELDDDLNDTVCGRGPGPIGFEKSQPGWAQTVLQAAGRYFLPQPLWAAVLEKLPPPKPIGGRAGSLSPFGVVEEAPVNQLNLLNEPNDHDTHENYFKDGVLDRCDDGCRLHVRMEDPSGASVGLNTIVTASLIVVDAPGETTPVLGGDITQPIEANGEDFLATFHDLTISEPGTYQLMFSAPGATPITSEEFDVYTLEFTLQPTSITEGEFLGQGDVGGFDFPVVRVAIVDYEGNPVETATDNIEVALNTELPLEGTTSVNAEGGLANFTQIESDGVVVQEGLTVLIGGCTALTDLELNAFADGVVQDNSSPFDVNPDC